MSNELTPRQAEILEFIRSHAKESGYPPTRAEICQAMGFRSPNAAEEHLRATLAVMPRDLFHVFGRALRRAQRADPLRHELRLVDVRVGRPDRLTLVDLVASLAGDDAGKGFRVAVGQFQADFA